MRGLLQVESHPKKVGSVTYANYDAHGHAHTRTDGGVTLAFGYDAAERLTDVLEGGFGGRTLKHFDFGTANSGGDLRLGKLTRAVRQNYVVLAGTEHDVEVADNYTYGGLDGRVSAKTTDQSYDGGLLASFQSTWAFDPLGNVASLGYPQCRQGLSLACTDSAPRTVNFTRANGFLTQVPGYATSITYHPNGMVDQVTHANNVIDTDVADPYGRRRPRQIVSSLLSPMTNLWDTGAYAFDGAGNLTDIGNAHFVYDGVSRLTSATLPLAASGAAVPSVSQSYSYDAFGNLQSIGGNSGHATPTNSSTNRLSSPGTLYDDAGDLTTAAGGAKYEYDPFHMMWHYCSTSGCYQTGQEWLYLYDADDERLWSFQVAGGFSLYAVRGLDHQVLRDYEVHGAAWSFAKDYLYRDGQLLASDGPTGVRHYSLDHLGSPRLVTNAAHQVTAYHLYYPYGEEATAFNQDTERMKFTGHERDLASPTGNADDLDYMHARFCSPVTGRFLSVDRGTPRLPTRAPQKWNRYSYVSDNPLRFNDPDGWRQNPVTGTRGVDPVPENGVLGRIRANEGNQSVGLFGWKRDQGNRFHPGIDINAPNGAPVYAAESGVVSMSRGPTAGNRLQITLADGTVLTYAHLSSFSSDLRTGFYVMEGAPVGRAGTTGNAVGIAADEEHLHFAVTNASGQRVNPIDWLNDPAAPEPKISTDPVQDDPLKDFRTGACQCSQEMLRLSPR